MMEWVTSESQNGDGRRMNWLVGVKGLFGKRADSETPSNADQFPHKFQIEDTRAPGYYLNNGDFWPDQICSRVPIADIRAHLALIPEVYDRAMADLGRQDEGELPPC